MRHAPHRELIPERKIPLRDQARDPIRGSIPDPRGGRRHGRRYDPRHPGEDPRRWVERMRRSDRETWEPMLEAKMARQPKTTKSASPRAALFECEIRRRPTLPGDLSPSTIGADRLNFRVRDGNGCVPRATATDPQGQRFRVLWSSSDTRRSLSQLPCAFMWLQLSYACFFQVAAA